jgi:hypothetical protein
LDIFNRGKISEVNINKWISESALYFLGTAFQTIRQKRLILDEPAFVALCDQIYQISAKEDI